MERKPDSLALEIERAALSCGFDSCGILPLEMLGDYEERLRERMEKVPSSAGFYKGFVGSSLVKKRFPWAQSAVVCAYSYGKYRYPKELRGRYAKSYFLEPEPGSDQGYNLERLEAWFQEKGIRWAGGRHFGNNSVFPLRHGAMKAGLGIIRKNNFFYTEQGSYITLVGYVIDKPCVLLHRTELRPCAPSCTLCQRACKTKALHAPYTMDPGKCVSFLNTFGKGNIPPGLGDEMLEEWLIGCDNCQDICPYNRHNWDVGEPFSNLEELAPLLTPEKVPGLSDEFIRQEVIPKTAKHLQPADGPDILRKNAQRALRFRDKYE